MTNNGKRRQRRGSAWYWAQTESWYYTPVGTKHRKTLRDEEGKPIRGHGNRQAARLALDRLRLKDGLKPQTQTDEPADQQGAWIVAHVCSEYLAHCERSVAAGRMVADYRKECIRYLNAFSQYCGAMPVAELKRGYVASWVESHPTWRSPVTRRNVITIVLAAFNHALNRFGIRNPLKGLKKPPPRPRLYSFSIEEEQAIYKATDRPFRDFLFAAIHTGLRPFCELAKLTADDVHETPRGMMWRVYSSKTKKTRKIPVRPEVAALTRRLMNAAPRGSRLPLFQNSRDKPWTKVAGKGRFLALKRKLGWNKDPLRCRYSCYGGRHTFAHRMLSGFWNSGEGCSIEVLAELLGNSPKVAADHYGKLWSQHYQDPLWAAIGTSDEDVRRHLKISGRRRRKPKDAGIGNRRKRL